MGKNGRAFRGRGEKQNPEGWKTTKKERRNYIIGDFGRYLEGAIVTSLMSTFLIFQGIDLTAIAGVMLAVKIIDAFDDVIFGYLIDRIQITKITAFSKLTGAGKYLPWYRLTFALFPLFTALFFCMPSGISQGAKLIWFVVFYLLYDLTYTLVEVPMNSMIVTLTDNMDERNSILQSKSILNALGYIGAGIVWMASISEYVGFSIRSVAIVSSVIFFVMMLPLVGGVKEHNSELKNVDPEENEKYTLKDMWNCVKTNKYLMVLMVSTVITQCLATGGAVGTLVSYYMFGSSLVMVIPIAIAFIPQLIAQLQTRKACAKFGKLRVLMAAGAVGALIQLSIYFVGPDFLWCCILLVVQAPFSNMSNIAKTFFLPDTIEYTRYKTGKDCSGICNAISSFVTKLTSSVSSSLGLFILGLSGYISVETDSFEGLKAAGVVQPQSALDCMWAIYALIPLLGTLFGVLIMAFYRLKDKDAELMAKCNAGEITKEECQRQLSREY
ncbi:MAG: MFS transporter [Lachnospiraceae bacterium]|nr:MFS transporter [Lachnospiraceae bacterium]